MRDDYTAENWAARRAKLSAEARAAGGGEGVGPANKRGAGWNGPALGADMRTPFLRYWARADYGVPRTPIFFQGVPIYFDGGGGEGGSSEINGSHPKGDPTPAENFSVFCGCKSGAAPVIRKQCTIHGGA
jgi:hypothetical protein